MNPIILDRRYRLDRQLGVGTTGTVYAAWHLHLDRPVAVKILHAQYMVHTKLVERFRFEAQAMGLLGHENVVKVIDFRHTGDQPPYLVMELIDGETLRARLARGPLPLAEATSLLRQLCSAVGQAHRQNIVHRDLKPENLMLQAPASASALPVLKVLDFGTSKLLGAPPSSMQLRPQPFPYMAPERVDPSLGRGVPGRERQVDIFAIGAILYEVLSGRQAFPATSLGELLRLTGAPPPPLQLADARLSAELDQVVRAACDQDPSRRPERVDQLWAAYQKAQAGPAPVSSLSSEATPPARAEAPLTPSFKPRVLSSSGRALGTGVKPVLLQALAQRVAELAGIGALEQQLGVGWYGQLLQVVATDWLDGQELRSLLGCAAELLGGVEAVRLLGRSAAEVLFTGIYAPLMRPGRMADVLRRRQSLLFFHNQGTCAVEAAGAGFRLQVLGLRTLDELAAAMSAGFLQRYLEMVELGPVEVSASARPVEGDEVPGWDFLVTPEPAAL